MSKPDPSDYGAQLLSQHYSMVLDETMVAGKYRARRTDSSVLERLWRHGMLHHTPEMGQLLYDAGNALASDWFIVGDMPPVISSAYDAMVAVSGGVQQYSDAQQKARKRLNDKLSKLHGLQKMMVIRVCCHDEICKQNGELLALRDGLKKIVSIS
jgi:hypothetical protein